MGNFLWQAGSCLFGLKLEIGNNGDEFEGGENLLLYPMNALSVKNGSHYSPKKCVSGLQMIGKCGFTQRNIVITALSLSIGLGFTQVPEIFSVFPSIVQNIFAENCVAVVFIVAVVLNLVLPKNMENETVQQTEKE